MNSAHFKNELRRIYANHGRTPSDLMFHAVWQRVESLPDAFLTWAADKLCDYEKLPGNLGREIERDLYPQWRAENGQPRHEQKGCHECAPAYPGWFFGWKRDAPGGMLYEQLIRCLCNADAAFDPIPRKSRAQAQREGFTVVPDGMRYGEFEKTLYRAPSEESTGAIGGRARSLACHPAPQETVRPAHAAQMAYYEPLAGAL